MSGFDNLYANYGKTSDKKIREYLDKITLVRLMNKGVGTMHGYYPITNKELSRIKEKPRGIPFHYSSLETKKNPIEGLTLYKTIEFLVKSSSRFFLKDDIGEVFDQIDPKDILEDKFRAIAVKDEYYEIRCAGNDEFLMYAILLK